MYTEHTDTCQYGVATISRLLKMISIFCKRAPKIDDIPQKRPRILRSLLIVATPCQKCLTSLKAHLKSIIIFRKRTITFDAAEPTFGIRSVAYRAHRIFNRILGIQTR